MSGAPDTASILYTRIRSPWVRDSVVDNWHDKKCQNRLFLPCQFEMCKRRAKNEKENTTDRKKEKEKYGKIRL